MLARTLLGLLAAAVAGIADSNDDLMDSLYGVPHGWEQIGVPSPLTRLSLKIAMRHPNQQLFDQMLLDISTPGHSRYGQHIGRNELKAMLRPHSRATVAVLDWLAAAGIHGGDVVDDGDWINFIATVETAEKLLATEFGIYRNEALQTDQVRTLKYAVPQKLHPYIDMIQPTTRFVQIRPEHRLPFKKTILGIAGTVTDTSASCNTSITPACLRDLYNMDDQITLDNCSDGFAAFNSFLNEYPRYSDLASFQELYSQSQIGQNFTWTSIAGGKLDQSSSQDSSEANLDVQYLMSIAGSVPIHAYSTAGLGPLDTDLDQPTGPGSNEPYLDFLQYVLALPDDELPHTLSNSYGEDEQSVPLAYRIRVCDMFGQLGARGVSVIFSSGDTGVGSACQTNDGLNQTAFLPSFPAACPYVTSVGGTHYIDPEQAVSFSSGGFSNTWARPSWQESAVTKYLSILGDRWEGLYNMSGRGFPDVAAQARNFHIIDKGRDSLISGTSASAPVFAGVIAMLNAARVQVGQPPLGFLNPWIYSTAFTGLNDIVEGGSSGCTGIDHYSGLRTPVVPYASWNATEGWDPVTGYGTPDFSKLLPLALNATQS